MSILRKPFQNDLPKNYRPYFLTKRQTLLVIYKKRFAAFLFLGALRNVKTLRFFYYLLMLRSI
jgi:hypothetical protein